MSTLGFAVLRLKRLVCIAISGLLSASRKVLQDRSSTLYVIGPGASGIVVELGAGAGLAVREGAKEVIVTSCGGDLVGRRNKVL